MRILSSLSILLPFLLEVDIHTTNTIWSGCFHVSWLVIDFLQEYITTELPSVSTSHIPNIRVRVIYP